MKHLIPLILVPTFLCVSCAKSQVAAPAPPSMPAALIMSGPGQPATPQIAAVTEAADTGPYSPPKTPGAIHLEAEDGVLTGNTVLTTRPGFAGKGYVGDFQADGAQVVWTIPRVKAGLYDVKIRYSSPTGQKGYDLIVNGKTSSNMFAGTGDKFAAANGGKVELVNGPNTIAIGRGWGYYDIDALDLIPAGPDPRLPKPSAVPVDPQATPQARALLKTLVGFYGVKTLSGQINEADTQYLQSVTGKTPAIMGGDLIEYSPSRIAHGSDPHGETERLIRDAKAGQIITLLWHWNAPADLIDQKTLVGKDGKTIDASWYRGFYTNSTTFDVQKALADPNSADYKLLLSNIDTIAVQLQKLSDAGVPVLWRPLHEAEGGWFWWGAKGPEPFKQLWRLMYDRLTNYHHLHNLIWVYCAGTDPAWYPGDAVVDVVGIDQYPSDTSDPEVGVWETLAKQHGDKKLLALTEFGGVPDVAKMARYGVRWSYFVSWQGDLGPHKMSQPDLTRIYDSPLVINKNDLAGR
jgi:mannan endo-1,4-beta-mannosidase